MMKRRGSAKHSQRLFISKNQFFLGLSLYVDQDSYHNDNADDLLPVRRYAHNVQTVCNGDEQTTDDSR